MVDKVWVPERFDNGAWDTAHWDGQLGFNAGRASVEIAPDTAAFAYKKICRPIPGQFIVQPGVASLRYDRVLTAGTSNSVWVRAPRSSLSVTPWPPPPGVMVFGHTVHIPRRW